MRRILDNFINNFIVKRSRQHRVLSALFVLALVVTLGVFLRLKLIGISMTSYDPKWEGAIEFPVKTIDNNPGGDYGEGKGFTINLYDYVARDEMATGLGQQAAFEQNITLRDYGINAGHRLHFLPNGANFDNNNYPNIDSRVLTQEHYTWGSIAVQGIVDPLLGDDGFPKLSTAVCGEGNEQESLAYLFPAEPVEGQVNKVLNGMTGLFIQEENWIEYDSAKYYAYANEARKQFGVNAVTFNLTGQDADKKVGFFPFDAMDYSKRNVNANVQNGYNHHFGLTMTAKFNMFPNKQVNGQDMEFRFDGDDDLWVFIDGVLVLDIGGIHEPVEGSINFLTGDVYVKSAVKVNTTEENILLKDGGEYELLNAAESHRDIYQIFKDAGKTFNDKVGSEHEIKVFYLERGGVYSNLKIMTNIFERQYIEVIKDWKDGNEKHTNDVVTYDVYKIYTDESKEPEKIDLAQHNATGILKASANSDSNWREVVSLLPVPDGTFDYKVIETSQKPGYRSLDTIVQQNANDGSTMGTGSGNKVTGSYRTRYALSELVSTSHTDSASVNKDEGIISYQEQWAQAFFAIPQEVLDAGLKKVIVNYTSDVQSQMALKLTTSTDKYGSGVLTTAWSNIITPDNNVEQIRELDIMNNGATAATYTISSIDFYTEREIDHKHYTLNNLYGSYLRHRWSDTTYGVEQNGTFTGGQYYEVIAQLPQSIPYSSISKVDVHLSNRNRTVTTKYYNTTNVINVQDTVINDQNAVVNGNGNNTNGLYSWTPTNAAVGNLSSIGIMLNAAVPEGEAQNRATFDYIDVYYAASVFVPDEGSGFNMTHRPGFTYILPNEPITEADIKVEKAWKDKMGSIEPLEGAVISVELLRYKTPLDTNGNASGHAQLDDSNSRPVLTLDAANGYTATFEKLATGDQNNMFTYSVAETKVTIGGNEYLANNGVVDIEGRRFEITYDKINPIIDGTIKVTNSLDGVITKPQKLVLTKKWVNNTGLELNVPVQISAHITREKQAVTFDADGNLVLGDKESDGSYARDEYLGPNADQLTKEIELPYIEQQPDGTIYKYTYSVVENGLENGQLLINGSPYEASYDEKMVDTEQAVTITNKNVSTYMDLGNSTVQIHKTIDSLMVPNSNGTDTTENPDTNITTDRPKEDDLYRLYLDIASYANQQPVDLLLVVDQSGSMYENNDIRFNGTNVEYRDSALSSILNGGIEIPAGTGVNRKADPSLTEFNPTAYQEMKASVTGESLINQFLSMNDANEVAVVGFDGNRVNLVNSYPNYEDTNYPYTQADGYNVDVDSTIIRQWSNSKISGTGIDVQGKKYTGTNYEAGLLQADVLLSESGRMDNGHRKIMIFISDGVPTCYIDDNGNRGGSTRIDKPSDNITSCVQPSIDAFAEFIKKYPELTVFSIGLSGELNESSAVLSKYVNNGGEYYYVGNNGNELRKRLQEILLPNGPIETKITDVLSDDVKYYEVQPDLIVTMRPGDAGNTANPIVIWRGTDPDPDNGMFADADNVERSIVKSVTYTASTASDSTGTVEVVFDEHYMLVMNQIYTVSYNVQVTSSAYEKLENRGGYLDVNGEEIRGSVGTDYARSGYANDTSSEKLGFRSNKLAEAVYSFEPGVPQEPLKYAHPVVQLKTETISVKKEWYKADGKTELSDPHLNAEIQLYRVETPSQGEGEASEAKPIDGKKVTLYKGHMTDTFSNLPLKGYDETTDTWYNYTYYVAEIVPNEADFEVSYSRGTEYGEPDDDGNIIVKNKLKPEMGYELPHTGGIGTYIYYMSGALLLATGLLFRYTCKRKRERRSVA